MRKPLLIARQGRRPSGLLGQIVARVMAKETLAENDAALELLRLDAGDSVLEVGCGHGDTLARAAKIADRGRHSGIDFSWVMHRHATRRHRRLVQSGQVEFRFGSSDELPFAAATFDKAFAVHTIYFWDAPEAHLGEIRRVLKPQGRFVLGYRPAEDARFGATYSAEVYRIRPHAEVVDLVRSAGFQVTETMTREFGGKSMSFLAAAPALASSRAA